MQCVRRRRPPGGASAHRCDGGSVLYYLPVSSPGCVRCVCEHALEVSGPLVGVLFLILSDSSQERHEKTPPVRGHSPRLSAAFLACPGLSRLSESVRRDLQASSTTRPAVAGWVQRAPRMLRRQRHVPASPMVGQGRAGLLPRRLARSARSVSLARSLVHSGLVFLRPTTYSQLLPLSVHTEHTTQHSGSPSLPAPRRLACHTSRGVARRGTPCTPRAAWHVLVCREGTAACGRWVNRVWRSDCGST